MKFTPKAAFFDIDGTLLSKKFYGAIALPTESVTRAVRATSKVIPTGLVTGRQIQKSINIIKHLELTGLSIISNGAQIYESKSDKMIVEHVLDHFAVIDIAKTLSDWNVPYWIQDNGEDIPFTKSYRPFKPFIFVAHKVSLETSDQIASMVKQFPNVVAFPGLAFPDGTYDTLITDSRANKKTALIEVAKMLEIETQDILGFGDGLNDIDLMECCYGVAMGNADKVVKDKAKYITSGVEEDGVAAALERLVL